MAGTVGSHQQGAFSSPTNGQQGDASVVLANDNAVRSTANAHDADATIHIQSSVLASRPAAGTAQRVWISTDGLRVYVDSGSVWNELAYLPSVGGTVTGAVTISAGGLSVTGGITGTLSTAAQPNITSVGVLAAPHMTAAVVDSGGLTVSSGTTAVQALTATTGAFSSDVTCAAGLTVSRGASGSFLTVGDSASATSFGGVKVLAGSGKYAWMIGAQVVTDNGFEIIPSTAAGGTTFTTPVLQLSRLGALTVSSTVTVSAGGIAVTGNSTITGTLGGLTGLTVASGGAAIAGNSTITGTLGGLTGLTVASGGATITAGDLTLSSGAVTASGAISAGGIVAATNQGKFGSYNGSGAVGFLSVSSDTNTTATAGAATLPATPVGFLAWHLGSTSIRIPYYNS